MYLLPGCADPFNEKAIRASRGASFKIPLEAGGVAEWLEICEAHALLKIAATSADVTTHPMRPCEDKQILKACSASLVLGSEGQGLSDAVLEQCNPVSIPMVGEMESLNVASAGAVLMCVLSESVDKLMSDLTQIMVGNCSKSS